MPDAAVLLSMSSIIRVSPGLIAMKTPTKDLFDDTTMTFGEHLEILRTHLIRAIIGLVITVIICLYKGDVIVNFIRRPIDRALQRYSEINVTDDTQAMKQGREKFMEDWGINTFIELFTGTPQEQREAQEQKAREASGDDEGRHPDVITVRVSADDLALALSETDPKRYPLPKPVEHEPAAAATSSENVPAAPSEATVPPGTSSGGGEKPSPAKGSASPAAVEAAPTMVTLRLHAPEFAQFQETVEASRRAVTLNVQEAFMTYIKVSLIAGIVLASPWIFYQIWQFVAAGLYPHERQYVYLYGTMSLVLFLAGAMFCFYAVFPFVLNFLLQFNASLKIQPQIRLSEWISFAVVLPLMFGISFQLPLVMLFLERISIFSVTIYQEQRRMAILVIAILSSILTPADPMSMLLMMFPLIFLYQLGIWLCKWLPRGNEALRVEV
jgi:sec-independent protein translocase protein TatC